MRWRLLLVLLVALAGTGYLLWQQVEANGALQEQVATTELALQQTVESMRRLDQMYQAADQQLVINRRQHQQINLQLRGEIDALRSDMATDLRAAACIPDSVADRLLSITHTATTRLHSGTGQPDGANTDSASACYSYSDIVSYVPELVAAIQQCNADKTTIRSINGRSQTE